MTSLTIDTSEIRCIDGLYSLNDLHKAAGGKEKHRPTFFLRNEQTKALVKELNCANLHSLKIIEGRNGGTYACKEFVIAYAAWISPEFHLKVIRVFLDFVKSSQAITKEQAGELSALIAERFQDGRQRPYAWGRFNNHFRLSSYKDLPASKFDGACEYIRQMPLKKELINLLDADEFSRARQIANQFLKDFIDSAKGKNVDPVLDMPDEVLAGIVAQQLSRRNFMLSFLWDGKLNVLPAPNPYETVKEAIADPSNIGLEDRVIEEIGQICFTALAHRAKRRREKFSLNFNLTKC